MSRITLLVLLSLAVEKIIMRYFLVIALLLVPAISMAGVYSDEMGKCLVASTSAQDKTKLVRWIFAISALHPDVASIASVSEAEREQMDRDTAALFERLVTESCRKQTMDAIRYEGAAIAFQISFGLLGQVAMQELMTDKTVNSGFENFIKYLDMKKLEALGNQQE